MGDIQNAVRRIFQKRLLGLFCFSISQAGTQLEAQVQYSSLLETTPQQIVIRIRGNELTPNPVGITSGTTVLWRNEAEEAVVITFSPKAVSTLCRAPRGFRGTAEGIDQSVALAYGQIASLCLIEPGSYRYHIQRHAGEPDTDTAATGAHPAINQVLQGVVQVSGR